MVKTPEEIQAIVDQLTLDEKFRCCALYQDRFGNLPRFGIASAKLFGSYARGEARPDSDIDVILYAGEGFRAFNVFGVAEELYRASGKGVDVYEIRELDEGPFKERVLAEAVEL